MGGELIVGLAAIALVGISARKLATRAIPSVLFELLGGMILGNLALIGIPLFEPMRQSETLDFLSRVGVAFLLFQIGLDSSVGELHRLGGRALLVASAGIAGTFVLGVAFWDLLGPAQQWEAIVFLAASLTATSVGITARILKDLGRSGARETKLIIAAAVIDDILGLIILVVMTSLVAAGHGGSGSRTWSVVGLAAFPLAAVIIGAVAAKGVARLTQNPKLQPLILRVVPFAFFCAFSFGAYCVGLPLLVGAFIGGLVLEESHLGGAIHSTMVSRTGMMLVPVFFIMTGLRIELNSVVSEGTLLYGLGLMLVAAGGKSACGLAAGRAFDRRVIAVGMIPRGEVQLIYANIGVGLGVVSPPIFAALVFVVLATTLFTPFILQRVVLRR